MEFLGVVPARGGSKGLSRKNLFPLNGKPMIQHTIEAALDSRLLSHCLLSTEDAEIRVFCKSFSKLDTSYQRPIELASDSANIFDVLADVVNWLKTTKNTSPQNIVLLQPTSPLRTAKDIDGALAFFKAQNAKAVVSVNEMHEHPFECIRFTGQAKNEWDYLMAPPNSATRRQDYDQKGYFINGGIYIAQTDWLLAKRSFVVRGETHFFEIPKDHGIDIDAIHDVWMAESLLRRH